MNHMPPNHQAVTERFVAACQADERVVAAFLGGSYGAGKADVHSDLDLFLITTDETYEAFCAERENFVRHLGEPLFLEDFGASDGLLFILADDTEGTVQEARRLFAMVGRPNVMIKVPATEAGISAIETLIAEGINVNVTLMFSIAHYDAVAEAYISGLEQLADQGDDLSQVASVASFFISRIDSAVDEQLAAMGSKQARGLSGKIAIANAKATYKRYQATFSGPRWEQLAGLGAAATRWAAARREKARYLRIWQDWPGAGPAGSRFRDGDPLPRCRAGEARGRAGRDLPRDAR